MALIVDFDAVQVPGNSEEVTFEDLSTGSDGAVTSRNIYIQQSNGDFLVEVGNVGEYSVWALPLVNDITLNLLTEDVGVRVVVEWVNSGGTVLYTKTKYFGFNCFNQDFNYSLTQNVASNQLLVNDNNFWENKSLLTELIDSGDNAIVRASDINSCQQCYDMATNMRLNSQYFFNENS